MATDSLARPLCTIGCLLFVHSMNFWLVSFFFVFNLCSLFFQVKLSSQNIIDQKCILSLFLCFYCLWCIIIFFDFFFVTQKKTPFQRNRWMDLKNHLVCAWVEIEWWKSNSSYWIDLSATLCNKCKFLPSRLYVP